MIVQEKKPFKNCLQKIRQHVMKKNNLKIVQKTERWQSLNILGNYLLNVTTYIN